MAGIGPAAAWARGSTAQAGLECQLRGRAGEDRIARGTRDLVSQKAFEDGLEYRSVQVRLSGCEVRLAVRTVFVQCDKPLDPEVIEVAHQKAQAEVRVDHCVCAALEIDQAQFAARADEDVLRVRVHVHEAIGNHLAEQREHVWQQRCSCIGVGAEALIDIAVVVEKLDQQVLVAQEWEARLVTKGGNLGHQLRLAAGHREVDELVGQIVQAIALFQAQVDLQALFPMLQAVVLEHPFAFAVQQVNAAGGFGDIERLVLLGRCQKRRDRRGQWLALAWIEMKGVALNTLARESASQVLEVTHGVLRQTSLKTLLSSRPPGL